MPPSPLSARSFFRDPIAYVRSRKSNAAIVRLAAGPSRFVLVRNPEAVWQVLVTDAGSFRKGKWTRRSRRFLGETLLTVDGEEHRRRRLMLQPSLARRRIAASAPLIVSRIERAQAAWHEGARITVRDEIDPLVLVVAGDVLLSTDLEPESSELAEALSTVMRGVPRLTPPLVGTRQARALARVDRAVSAVIAERRRTARSQGDLVDALLRSGLPERTVRGEVITLLLAAVDEPPRTLEAAWYLLGRAPAAEERLHAELDSVIGDRPATLDDGARLRYLDAVLRETLRLCPPIRHLDRCAVEEVLIDGARVRAGSNVIVSPLVTHRESGVYERPSAFLPERWLGDTREECPRGAYVPFGAGPHACIGAPLAWAIMTLTLATIGRRWRLRVDADAPAPAPRAPRLGFALQRR